MKDTHKPKQQLTDELAELRHRIAALETSEAERIRTEEALRESEEKYRGIFDTVSDAILIFDAQTRQIMDVNHAAQTLYGYTREEFLKLGHPTITAEPVESDISIMKTLAGELTRIPLRYHQKKDGTIFPVEISSSTFSLGDRHVVCGVIRDITERKQAEKALERRVNELSALNAIAAIVSQSLDVNEILNQAVDQALSLVGVEAAGFHLLDNTTNELRLTVYRGVSDQSAQALSSFDPGEGINGKVVQTGEPIILNDLADYPSPEKAYAEKERLRSAAIVPLKGATGVIGTMNLSTSRQEYFGAEDVALLMSLGQQIAIGIEKARLYEQTRDSAAELEQRVEERTADLAASEAHYRTLFDNALDAITVVDMQGRYLDVNPAACQLFDYSRKELLAMDVFQVWLQGRDASPKKRPRLLQERQALWRQGISGHRSQMVTKTGEVVDVEMTITPIRYDGQEAALGVLRDISERVQAEQEIQQRTEDLALINTLNDASNHGASLQEIINLLVQETKRIYSSTGTTVYLMSDDKKYLIMQNFTLAPGKLARIEKLVGLNIPPVKLLLETDTTHSELLQTGKPRISNDPETIQQLMAEFIEVLHPSQTLRQQLQKLLPQIFKILDIHSVISVPLVSEGEALGLLEISRVERFTQSDTYRLATIAGQLTAIIKRKQAEKELETRARQQAVVAELGQQALARGDFSALINEAVVLVAETLMVEYCKILELCPDGNTLLLRAGVGWKEGYVGQATLDTGTNSQAGYTLHSDEPVIVKDLRLETRFNGPPILYEHNIVSGMSVIIPGWEQPFGVLGAHTTKERTFTQDDIHFLQAIANVLAEAIERKRTENALQEYSERLEEMVEERTQELRETQEQLVRQEKLAVLGQLAGGVAHELRNPLGAIKNAAYFLNMSLDDPASEIKDGLQILDRQVAIADQIITSLLDFARSKPPLRQALDVNVVLREVLSRTTTPENIEVVSQLEESLPVVLADSNQLAQVFDNLIRNAIQAMPEGGQLAIKSAVTGSDWATISFADTGVGIPEENLARLFEPLFTTKAKGIGLGLALGKMLVEGHGGIIEVQSNGMSGKGSTFTVKLPLTEPVAPA